MELAFACVYLLVIKFGIRRPGLKSGLDHTKDSALRGSARKQHFLGSCQNNMTGWDVLYPMPCTGAEIKHSSRKINKLERVGYKDRPFNLLLAAIFLSFVF